MQINTGIAMFQPQIPLPERPPISYPHSMGPPNPVPVWQDESQIIFVQQIKLRTNE
jgi:hypothetical protein